MEIQELIKKFELQLANNVIEMKKYGRFSQLQKLLNEKGYYDGAKILINKDETSGLSDLMISGKADISIEHLALNKEFQPLFTADELKKCKHKLGLK